MAIASFVFTSYKNSFCVLVKNLEELEVQQIQEIESFVKKRNGIFDFSTYTFIIKKKIEFEEFVKLIQNSSLEATCIEKYIPVVEKPRISFGQYKGLFYEELPDSYLLWLKNNYIGKDKKIIEEELKSRI